MLERELLVRLADDREQRARLHELCLDAGGSPARSERVCRARREVAEVLDEVGARNQLGREHELEQAEGRFAELLRDRPAGAELQDADRRRAPAPVGGPHRGVELGGAVQTQPPQGDPLGARELEGEPQDVRGAVRRVGAGGERVRGDAKRGLRPAVLPLLRAERARGERRPVPRRAALRFGRSRRSRPRSGAARRSRAPRRPRRRARRAQLSAPSRSARRATRRPAPRRARPRPRAARRAAVAHPRARPRAPPRGLRPPARRGHRGPSSTILARTTSAPVRPAAAPTTRPQDVSEPASPRGGPAGVRERFQRPRIESGPLAPLRLHCHPASSSSMRPRRFAAAAASRLRPMAPARPRSAPPARAAGSPRRSPRRSRGPTGSSVRNASRASGASASATSRTCASGSCSSC